MTDYSPEFYRYQREGSRRSASVILPLIFEALQPASVVDVGCGVGTWLSVASGIGADVLGLDGDYVDRRMLEIPVDRFRPTDLTQPVRLDRRFDLALCLEVGEHLPTPASETLVRSLTSLSDAVAFSAAIPGQGGNQHINEQWQSFWAELFGRHGYQPVDFIRPRVWSDERVEDFYAQNLILYCAPGLLERNGELRRLQEASPRGMLNLVHPKRYLYKLKLDRIPTRELLRVLPGKLVRGVAYRFRWLKRR